MLTYVINTSENKTLDSDKLFELAGYRKIRWMNRSLHRVEECIKEIFEKQNVLGADEFRIAVIIDFFGYDRIRAPYGRMGFTKEFGVDASTYEPLIEAYLMDTLIEPLTKKDLYPADFEIYYAQNGSHERYTALANDMEQLRQIVYGDESSAGELSKKALNRKDELETQLKKELKEAAKKAAEEEEEVKNDEGRDPDAEDEEEEPILLLNGRKDTRTTQEKIDDLQPYGTYMVHCTKQISLPLDLLKYPYGTAGDKMNFEEFYEAFGRRAALHTPIRRHYYQTHYDGSAARAAFDTLALSLYLIRMYEREGVREEGEIVVNQLDPMSLKDVLTTAWMKISVARRVAIDNQSEYFLLAQNSGDIVEDSELTPREEKELIRKERVELLKSTKDERMSVEDYYHSIRKVTDRTVGEMDSDNQKKFDEIMAQYLKQRDSTTEGEVEADFASYEEIGTLKKTKQCPSKMDYQNAILAKKRNISKLFDRALKAEYIQVDFSEELEDAKKARADYYNAKSCMSKNIIGDIIFMILTVAVMFMPYYFLQLTNYEGMYFTKTNLILMSIGIFAGLFICAFLIQILPLMRKMSMAKERIRRAYIEVRAKQNYSFSALRQRYEKDLIRIEQSRYELRQIRRLHELNQIKEQHITMHRNMLEEVQDKLSSMLNNLDVEPLYNTDEQVLGEFNIDKSFMAQENKIYKIFSIETIEKMFASKGVKHND